MSLTNILIIIQSDLSILQLDSIIHSTAISIFRTFDTLITIKIMVLYKTHH